MHVWQSAVSKHLHAFEMETSLVNNTTQEAYSETDIYNQLFHLLAIILPYISFLLPF